MQGKLPIIKNMIWAVAIILALAALLVGLIIAAASRYSGEQQDGILYLGGEASAKQDSTSQADQISDTIPPLAGDGSLITLPETSDGGQSYLDDLTFLCDSALIGLRDYGLLSGGTVTSQVWGSSAGNIPASSIAQCTIVYPGDGSQISAASAAMIAKPRVLVIALGCDSLSETDQESFIANYTALLNSIHQASPETTLICCSPCFVTASYSGSDGLTRDTALQAEQWIQQVCMATGVYYADLRSVLCDNSGTLLNDYASSNGKTLNSSGISKVLEYLRSHTV